MLLGKEELYNNLNTKKSTDSDFMHGKRICKNFEIKHLSEYHDLYFKRDQLLLADVFENFRKMCLKNYQLDPSKSLSAPGLAGQAALKKTDARLKLLTDIDLLIKVGERFRGGTCNAVHQYAKKQW